MHAALASGRARAFGRRAPAHGVPLRRSGLNSGWSSSQIGSDLRMDYTAVATTTNLAARMEQLAAPAT